MYSVINEVYYMEKVNMSFVSDGPKAHHNIFSGECGELNFPVLRCMKHEPAFKSSNSRIHVL